MILYFHFDNFIYEYPLPACNDRRIKLNLSEELGNELGAVDFEVWDNVWHIVSGNDVMLSINNQLIDDHVLKAGEIINGNLQDKAIAFTITVHAIDHSNTIYDKYEFSKETLVIGGDAGSDIIIKNLFVSRKHTTIRREGKEAILCDYSKNGTYVQNRRVNGECRLYIMDVIYITGVKIIYMGDFFAINQREMRDVRLRAYSLPTDAGVVSESSTALIRSPRILEPLDTESVELESPPAPQLQRRQPVVFIVGPALTMPLPIMASVLFNASQNSSFMLGTIMSVAMSAAVTASWAIANVFYEKNKSKKDEMLRQHAYMKYISENEANLINKQNKNASILRGRYLSLGEIQAVLPHNKAVLWNRNVNQPDFLVIRLGIGFVNFQCEINVPKRKFSLISDPLQAEPHKIREKYRLLPDSVSLLNLGEAKTIGVLGSKSTVRQIAKLIALQTAVLHCYTDVKMAFLLRPGEERHYEWARCLPHVRWQENKIRLMCAEDAERQNVLFYLNGILRTRMENQKETDVEKGRQLPHIVIFCTDPELIAGENIYRYLAENKDLGVTFVLLYGVLDKIPNECNHIIQYDDKFKGYFRLDNDRDETSDIRYEFVDDSLALGIACLIGGYRVAEQSSGEIPAAISFLEMYEVLTLKDWDLLKRWKENRSYESLRALVGIGSGGKPLYLDIHEKQHGPHGLIAGTTGSGKSETIQSYILSLVMNYHPNEISLILIDYKGGGMANAFIGLPHLAGTITNLDGNQTSRALLSIKAEIKHRQTLFKDFNVNHIDNYSRYFRDGTAKEPMPHLIIISDEFAELKKEQPEFIKELVSTARVGRSLGIHLILATQKPSGVVDDEIWSNSRFKICLRVQEKQDSVEMLHRPDATYLTNTGRAYMQIGNDEIFELFQTGYSGAYYEPEDVLSEENMVTMIGLDGSPRLLRKKKAVGTGVNRPTQLSASIDFICETAGKLGIPNNRQLWQPELSEGITLDDIPDSYEIHQEKGLTVLCGLIDDPSAQTQYGALLNFSKLGNLLIAGIPGVGKSSLIQTMLYYLVTNYPPQEVNFYCIDCSGSLSRVFEGLPHCGCVVGADDSERIFRLFQLVQDLINTRKSLFDKEQVGSYPEYRLVSKEALPVVLLVIDNLYAFNERYPEIVDDQLISMSHICMRYGIHIVISVNHMSDIKFRLRQNFDHVLPLQLAERGDYHDALGVMPHFLPPSRKGSGLWGKEALEYQAVLAVKGDNEQQRAEKIRADLASSEFCRSGDFSALSIRYIPKDQVYSEFLEEANTKEALCIGYDTKDVSFITMPLRSVYCYAVSAANRKGTVNMLQNMMEAAAYLGARRYLVALKHELDQDKHFEGIYRDHEGIYNFLVLLKDEFTKRSAVRKQLLAENTDFFSAIRQEQGLIFVFIDNMNDFLNVIYDTHEEDYFPLVEFLLERGKGLGIYFIAGFEPAVYGSNMFRDAYKHFVEYGTGIHIGGQLDKQKLFDISFLSRDNMKHQDVTVGLTLLDDQFVNVYVPLNHV